MPPDRIRPSSSKAFPQCSICRRTFQSAPGLSRHLALKGSCKKEFGLTLERHLLGLQLEEVSGDQNDNAARVPIPGENHVFDAFMENVEYAFGENALDTGNSPALVLPIHGATQISDTGLNSTIVLEKYPGAGKGSRSPQAEPEEYERVSKVKPHLLDPDTWALACWLMTSGLSGQARDKYFKLQKVSCLNQYHIFWNVLTISS